MCKQPAPEPGRAASKTRRIKKGLLETRRLPLSAETFTDKVIRAQAPQDTATCWEGPVSELPGCGTAARQAGGTKPGPRLIYKPEPSQPSARRGCGSGAPPVWTPAGATGPGWTSPRPPQRPPQARNLPPEDVRGREWDMGDRLRALADGDTPTEVPGGRAEDLLPLQPAGEPLNVCSALLKPSLGGRGGLAKEGDPARGGQVPTCSRPHLPSMVIETHGKCCPRGAGPPVLRSPRWPLGSRPALLGRQRPGPFLGRLWAEARPVGSAAPLPAWLRGEPACRPEPEATSSRRGAAPSEAGGRYVWAALPRGPSSRCRPLGGTVLIPDATEESQSGAKPRAATTLPEAGCKLRCCCPGGRHEPAAATLARPGGGPAQMEPPRGKEPRGVGSYPQRTQPGRRSCGGPVPPRVALPRSLCPLSLGSSPGQRNVSGGEGQQAAGTHPREWESQGKSRKEDARQGRRVPSRSPKLLEETDQVLGNRRSALAGRTRAGRWDNPDKGPHGQVPGLRGTMRMHSGVRVSEYGGPGPRARCGALAGRVLGLPARPPGPRTPSWERPPGAKVTFKEKVEPSSRGGRCSVSGPPTVPAGAEPRAPRDLGPAAPAAVPLLKEVNREEGAPARAAGPGETGRASGEPGIRGPWLERGRGFLRTLPAAPAPVFPRGWGRGESRCNGRKARRPAETAPESPESRRKLHCKRFASWVKGGGKARSPGKPLAYKPRGALLCAAQEAMASETRRACLDVALLNLAPAKGADPRVSTPLDGGKPVTLSPGPGLHTSGLEGASVPGVPALPHTPGRTPTPAREADLGLSKRRRMVQICSAPGSRSSRQAVRMAFPSLPSLPLRCTQPHMPPARQRPGSSSAAARTAQPPPLQLQPLPAGRAGPSQGQSQPGTLSHEGSTHWEPRDAAQERRPALASRVLGPAGPAERVRGRTQAEQTAGAPGGPWRGAGDPFASPSCDPRLAAGGPRAGVRPGPPGAPGRPGAAAGVKGGERAVGSGGLCNGTCGQRG
uniref:collagen alpha-1(I) chain-like n=1 Tax=Nyctereutes procyonoides TaxID=34880 RepID=UPI0024443914|nr:collagen alpha-1(I) chain-like [Nyctereutes procyonoides]